MTQCIALLRGINVGGHRRMPMAELRSLCAALGFEDTKTYIQSGNLLFRTEDVAGASARLNDGIRGRFGFEVPVVVRTRAELVAAAAATPFAAEAVDGTKVHVAFLTARPEPERVAALPLDRSPPDRYVVIGRELHLHTPNGLGRSKLTPDWLERKLGVRATFRNWKTVQKLLALAA